MKFTEHYFEENSMLDNPNFMKWFKGSKVVDKNGKPLVVYHGSKNAGFSVFDRSKSRSGKLNTMGPLIYVTKDREYAGGERFGGEGAIYPLYARVLNPIYAYDQLNYRQVMKINKGYGKEVLPPDFRGDVADAIEEIINNDPEIDTTILIKSLGGDAIEYHTTTGVEFYGLISSNQIKSAIGNNGNFDPNSDNINELNLTEMPHGEVDGRAIDFKLEKQGWDKRLIALIKNIPPDEIDDLLKPFYRLQYKKVLLNRFNNLDVDSQSRLLKVLPVDFIEDMNLSLE